MEATLEWEKKETVHINISKQNAPIIDENHLKIGILEEHICINFLKADMEKKHQNRCIA